MRLQLDDEAPELAKALRAASRDVQRRAAVVACDFAIRESAVDSGAVRDALETLRRGQSLSAEVKHALESLQVQLDRRYFELQEMAERHEADGNMLSVFGRARAVSAVLCASADDSFEAAAEAVYEASVTTENPEHLYTEVLRLAVGG